MIKAAYRLTNLSKAYSFGDLRVHDHHRGGSMAVGRRDIPAAAESSLLDS